MAVQRQKTQAFRKTLTLNDFTGIATANQTAINGQWVDFGALSVLAGQEYAFGQNIPAGATIHGAPIYLRIDNESGVQIHGKCRLVYQNPQQTKSVVVFEESTYRLDDGSTGDLTLSPLLSEYPVRVPEDGRLVLQFNSDGVAGTTQTMDYNGTNTRAAIPSTVYQ